MMICKVCKGTIRQERLAEDAAGLLLEIERLWSARDQMNLSYPSTSASRYAVSDAIITTNILGEHVALSLLGVPHYACRDYLVGAVAASLIFTTTSTTTPSGV